MSKIFIGNLPEDIRERDLEDEFKKFGRVLNISLKFPPRPPPFAFLEFEDIRDAEDAVRDMNGRDLFGHRLRVELSRGGPRDRDSRGPDRSGGRRRGSRFRVILSNLPTSVSWQDLKDFLRTGGDVVHTDVDRRGGGEASFTTYDEMDRAIRKLDDTDLNGERVVIREDRDGSRSRSRSYSPRRRRRSYSRSPPRRSRRRSRSDSRSPARSRGRRDRSYSRSRSRSYSRSRSRSRSHSKDKNAPPADN